MDRQCDCSAGVGGWSRVAYLNMSDPTHQCPPAWREITEPVRTCGRNNQTLVSPFFGTDFGLGGCSSAFFSSHNISYSHVCGRIIGYQIGSANGFQPYNAGWYTRIEDPYVDGVVITRGTEKQHIWTFAVVESYCPCNTQLLLLMLEMTTFANLMIACQTVYSVLVISSIWDGENCGTERPAVSLTLHHTFARTYS